MADRPSLLVRTALPGSVLVGIALAALVVALTLLAGLGAASLPMLFGCGVVGFVLGTALMFWLYLSRGVVLTDLGRLLAHLWNQFGKTTNR